MASFVIKWLINAISILIVTHIVKGIEVVSPAVALVAAFVLGIINAFLRPLLIFVTLPINILTLGLLTFFINGFMFYLVSKIVKGLVISGFWPAFFGYILISIISFLLSVVVIQDRKDW